MTRKLFPPTVVSLLLALVLAVPMAHAAPPPAAQQRTHAAEIAQLFDLHNTTRAQHGLRPLVYSPVLANNVSQPYNDTLSDADRNLVHNTIEGMNWPGARGVGENLAMASPRLASPAQFLERWMNSPGHRANILNGNWSHIAIGWSVSPKGNVYSTVNFYAGTPSNIGTTYSSGSQLQTALQGGAKPPAAASGVDVYTTPGTHTVNGRQWRTTCTAYGALERCRAEIWATTVTRAGGQYVQSNGWAFNNLTYKPAPRSAWAGNPLARTGSWTDADGRRWQTSCNDSWTGPNGCRTFVEVSLIESSIGSSGNREFRTKHNVMVFNNVVRFSE